MNESLKPTILSALVLALSGLGDALLYPVLPVNAAAMGVPLSWVGVLLSVNRFIRLAANQAFGWLFNAYGFKRITIIAALLSVFTTLAYGISGTIFLWLGARIIWGLCYSSLRISCIAYALEGGRTGFRLGLSRGLQETGPIVALMLGPLIWRHAGPAQTFIVFSLLSVPAVILAFYLPEMPRARQEYRFSFNPVPSTLNALVLLSALIVEGVLVVVIVKLLGNGATGVMEMTGLAALYIGYRRLSNVVLSPLAGKYADRVGIEKVFLVSILFTVLSLLLLVAAQTAAGLVLAFTFQSVGAALSPGHAAGSTGSRLKSIAANTTWRDLGAAAGALIGGFLLKDSDVTLYILLMSVTLLVALGYHLLKTDRHKLLMLWK